MEYGGLRPTYFRLSRKITMLCFPKKFGMTSFDHYSGTSDPLIHLHQYEDKMSVYAHDDLLLCQAFSSRLKGIAYHWFNSLPRNLL